MELLGVLVVAYLVGSLPTAYLVVRRAAGTDIRSLGSGNVGAMNSYEVTGRWRIGVGIFVIDFAKGLTAVALVSWISHGDFLSLTIGFFGVILGHVFSPWIGFKGGRGLAPATGAMALLAPLGIVTWVLVWVAARSIRITMRNSNVAALTATMIAVLLAPPAAWWPSTVNVGDRSIAGGMVLLIGIATMILAHFRGPREEINPPK